MHTRTVRRWTWEAAEALQDCFQLTDWDVLCEPHGEDIDRMTVSPITSDSVRTSTCQPGPCTASPTTSCKDSYRRKLEAKLQQNSVSDVWTGMKNIAGMNGNDRQASGSLERANQFNQFFNRFSSPPAPPAP